MGKFVAALAALSVAFAPVVVMSGDASADAKSSSTVVVTRAAPGPAGTEIRGKVESEKSSCKKRRTVRVYHDVAPPGPSDGDFLLGEAKSNKRGKWRLDTPFAPDQVYAALLSNDKYTVETSPTVPVS